jgi:hypothetical protein
VELLHFDGGTEFITSQINTIPTSLGIKLQTNALYTPEKTGVMHSTVPKNIEEPLLERQASISLRQSLPLVAHDGLWISTHGLSLSPNDVLWMCFGHLNYRSMPSFEVICG